MNHALTAATKSGRVHSILDCGQILCQRFGHAGNRDYFRRINWTFSREQQRWLEEDPERLKQFTFNNEAEW